jgi:hypothetical protein
MAFEIEVKTSAFTGATFCIDKNCLRWKEKEILIKNITGFGYMQTQTRVNGINASKTFEINIWEGGEDKKTTLRFMGAFGGGEANDKYLTVTDQLWHYFGDDLLNQMHQDLLNGKVYEELGHIKLIPAGIVVRRKPLFKPAYELLINWHDINISTFQGNMTIKSKTNKKAYAYAGFISKNVWLLYNYIGWLANNPDIIRALQAVPCTYKLIEKTK